MKRTPGPTWTAEQTAAGQRFGQAWVDFFSGPGPTAAAPTGLDADVASRTAIRAKHEAQLLGYPNVVGVIDGVRMRGGKPTNEPAIVVLVSRKVPRKSLAKASLLPSELEGVPVDVVEVGPIEALDSDLPTAKGTRRARGKIRPG
jgi:hypothetical protein